MADAAAKAAAQQAAICRLNNLPKFYSNAKDTITAENLFDRIDASVHFHRGP